MYRYPTSGVEILLLSGYEVKETRHGKSVRFSDLNGLHRAVSIALVDDPRPLSGGEFRFLRKELDFSQQALAEMLHRSEATISLWERGNDVDFLAQVALRQLVAERLRLKTTPLRDRLVHAARNASGARPPMFFEFDGADWSRADRAVKTEIVRYRMPVIDLTTSAFAEAWTGVIRNSNEQRMNLQFAQQDFSRPSVRFCEAV